MLIQSYFYRDLMHSSNLEDQVKAILSGITLPELEQDIVSSNWVKSISKDDGQLIIKLKAGFPCRSITESMCQKITEKLKPVFSDVQISVLLDWEVYSHSRKQGVAAIPGVKNIIAVASGKGGVGKSTVSVNLALALQQEGARVGLLDADIYGPSQPIMLGKENARPVSEDKKHLMPIEQYGIQSMSIGYLIEPEQAMVWRGPMASSALQQLINDTQWNNCDYLIVDLPPGTGDIQLTLSQKVPITASVIVTTPQDIALADAVKAISMFEKVSVPVLGIVENMAMHICSQCGHAESIFGEGGGESLAQKKQVGFLGQLPLAKQIRDDTDKGKPTVVSDPDSELSLAFRQIARKMSAQLSLKTKDFSQSFPTISITND